MKWYFFSDPITYILAFFKGPDTSTFQISYKLNAKLHTENVHSEIIVSVRIYSLNLAGLVTENRLSLATHLPDQYLAQL